MTRREGANRVPFWRPADKFFAPVAIDDLAALAGGLSDAQRSPWSSQLVKKELIYIAGIYMIYCC